MREGSTHTKTNTHMRGLRTTLAFITHHSLFHPLQCHSLTLLCAPALAVSTSWAVCSSVREGGCMQAHIHTTGVRRSSQATSLLLLECCGLFSLFFFFHIFVFVFLPTRLFCHLWDQVDLQKQEPGSFHCTNPVGTNLWILTAKRRFSVKECWGAELAEKWQCAMCVFVCWKRGAGGRQMITKQ